jgi:hypothetical protein
MGVSYDVVFRLSSLVVFFTQVYTIYSWSRDDVFGILARERGDGQACSLLQYLARSTGMLCARVGLQKRIETLTSCYSVPTTVQRINYNFLLQTVFLRLL